MAEKDRPEIRFMEFQGQKVPLPIGITEPEFRARIHDWLAQFPTADLYAVFGSRTHFTYGYLPVLDEKSPDLSDLDLLIHYPWLGTSAETVTFVRAASQEFKVKTSFITRNLPDLAQFVRNREFQFPQSMDAEKNLYQRARASWWRNWRDDERQRFLDLSFKENPFVHLAERRQRAEGRISVREPWAVMSVNKEAIIFLPRGPHSEDAALTLRNAGFVHVFEIDR